MHRHEYMGEVWIIQREHDPGWLGDGSKADHMYTADALCAAARDARERADKAGRSLWTWKTLYGGCVYRVSDVARFLSMTGLEAVPMD